MLFKKSLQGVSNRIGRKSGVPSVVIGLKRNVKDNFKTILPPVAEEEGKVKNDLEKYSKRR